MTESPARKVSGRKRFPTQKIVNYDRSQGALTTLAKSVGRPETPPTAESEQAARGKEQAAKAAARGNTSRPGPLKPLSQVVKQGNNDGESDKGDTGDTGDEGDEGDEGEEDKEGEEGQEDMEGLEQADNNSVGSDEEPQLLDHKLDQLVKEADRIEWLYQAIESWGVRKNYRNDPDFQDELSLRKEWKRVVARNMAGRSEAARYINDARIKKGQTLVLKPQTSGHSSRVKLSRMDNETIGLDGKRANHQAAHDHGALIPDKLTRTDRATIGLDGRVVSPPCRGPSGSGANHPTGTKRVSQSNIAAPSKKRAIVLTARLEQLRKLDVNKKTGPCVTLAKRASPPQPHHSPPSDEAMDGPPSDDGEPLINRYGRCAPQPGSGDAGDGNGGKNGSDDDNGDGNSGGENSDPEADDLGNTGDDPVAYHKLTKRQRTQLCTFPLEVQTLIRWVFDKIKLDIASLCPFADNMTDELDINATVFNRWIVERWREANEEICPDMPPSA
ncbi:hypothetical protein RhiLY_12139 [Ceratobasidium sp. AG-Ba]|nr:hypothetical protein RhiLY_12139 [Ceratobasidium sp. AG-Ba]